MAKTLIAVADTVFPTLDPARKALAALDPELVVAEDKTPMTQTLAYTAGIMQMSLPPVYHRPDDPGGLSVMFTKPQAIGLGKGALGSGPPQALAFVGARHLAYYRPGVYLRHLVPTGSGLRAWLLAALKSANSRFPVPPELAGQVAEHQKAIDNHLNPPQHEKLRSMVGKLLATAPELDMKRWVAAVDLTADRLGFVIANDLGIASAVIKASPEDAAAGADARHGG